MRDLAMIGFGAGHFEAMEALRPVDYQDLQHALYSDHALTRLSPPGDRYRR